MNMAFSWIKAAFIAGVVTAPATGTPVSHGTAYKAKAPAFFLAGDSTTAVNGGWGMASSRRSSSPLGRECRPQRRDDGVVCCEGQVGERHDALEGQREQIRLLPWGTA
ncbi:hypothetical protein NUW58_g9905 [Xylaria curta]|uniref:Uncharacterized protein n=1 Tax=Xylaria curta TaxID=42375 RepID=A0ACC1MSQ9_9PEZI|nr:hypothetical protein NUW58_g9905 [Xylaria curta]